MSTLQTFKCDANGAPLFPHFSPLACDSRVAQGTPWSAHESASRKSSRGARRTSASGPVSKAQSRAMQSSEVLFPPSSQVSRLLCFGVLFSFFVCSLTRIADPDFPCKDESIAVRARHLLKVGRSKCVRLLRFLSCRVVWRSTWIIGSARRSTAFRPPRVCSVAALDREMSSRG